MIFDPPGPGSRHHGPMYCRSASLARTRLETAVLRLYGKEMPGHMGCVFPSGMAAIGACMVGITHGAQRDIVVYGNELYGDVARTVAYLQGVQGVPVDVRDRDQLIHVFQTHGAAIAVFHYEACTNPSGQMFDVTVLPVLRELAPNCVVVCDNTWLSGVLYNPFDHGVDLVVESCTKYLSGSDCIGGIVCGAHDAMQPVMEWCRVMGQYVPPTVADRFCTQLESMERRVKTASAIAEDVAAQMECMTFGFDRVMYPLLPSHPTHDVAARLLRKGGPACIWAHLGNISKNRLTKRLVKTGCSGLALLTSFGGPDTRIDPWPSTKGQNAYDGHDDVDPSGCWVRIAVGYEDTAERVVEAVHNLAKLAHQ